jgi:hypothetical protein
MPVIDAVIDDVLEPLRQVFACLPGFVVSDEAVPTP